MLQEISHAVGDLLDIPGLGQGIVRQFCRGRLGSSISRLLLSDDRSVYLKEGMGEAAADLKEELRRLEWLRGRLPVPAADRLPDTGDGVFRILLESLPGHPSHYARVPKAQRVDILAQTLRDIHAVSVDSCPFRDTLEHELAEAERRIIMKKLDMDAFLEGTKGTTPTQVLAKLQATRGIIQETVFTHGDYCLPNVMIEKGRLSGIIDWGIAGVADPHRDFMAVADSIEYNLGPDWVERFFDAYGGPRPDKERIRYYKLLDQFYAHYRP